MYVNVNGIKGKIESLQTAAETYGCHVVTVAETKQVPPRLAGYSEWMTKNRKHNGGGGVAIAVRNDIELNSTKIEISEDSEQEVMWIEIKLFKEEKLYVGVYYGKQEGKTPLETIENEFSQISTQITKLRKKGKVVLTGDFNTKIKVNKDGINQNTSPNGRYLEEMISNLNLEPISTKSETGTWTRVNRSNPQEKSIIDYIIIPKEIIEQIKENIVDEEGVYRIKGRKETDHNTLLCKLSFEPKRETKKIVKWKLNNKEGWKLFNEQIKIKIKEINNENYNEVESTIKETLNETVGKSVITLGKKRNTQNEKIKELKQKKKEAKKIFESENKENSEAKKQKLEMYVKAQKEVRKEIEEDTIKQTRDTLTKLSQEGGTKSNMFWRLRKKYLGGNTQTNYDTMTENGEMIRSGEETKKHIADYFEDLYQAREGKPEYNEWTERIKKEVQEINDEMRNKPPVEKIEVNELNRIIKKLKRNKATGPDEIPNEIFIEADSETREIYLETMNKIAMKITVPEKWQEGEIKRLYKGKGEKGKCSNERGITLSSNFGKVYERVMNERAKAQVNMTELQAGGSRGRATVDHILVMKEIINYLKNKRKRIYVAFLDVTKAYDKAWLDAIMYVMYKQGLQDKTWAIVKNLNENLTAKIETKYGKTRKIRIKDSIRQGGVLSVLQYALLMDEISKEIHRNQKGVKLEDINETIGCLLWMDDVLLIAEDPNEMKEMLKITDRVANIYHIEFGKAKSNVMKIGKKGEDISMSLGSMEMDYTNKYKYLGLIQNTKNNLEEQIKGIRGKVEVAYQTILAIATDQTLINLEMETIWKNIETCIIPIITYSGEVWNPTKTEWKEINRILEALIKRVLMVPISTPREVLYIETGLLEPETTIRRNRILMQNRINKGDTQITKRISEMEQKGGWKVTTESIKSEMNIENADMEGSKNRVKSNIGKKTKEFFKEKIEKEGNQKSKVKYLLEGLGNQWKPGMRQKYLNKLTRRQASTIFKARTRMLDVKNNFRNKYKDTLCRQCNQHLETQEHVLEECKSLHPNEANKVRKSDLFSVNVNCLKVTVSKIETTLEKLEEQT